MKVKRVEGRLADNAELVQRAMARAKSMSALEPLKRHVDDEHWVFVFPKESPPAPGDHHPASSSDRSPQNGGRG